MQNLGIDVLFKGTNMIRLLEGLWVSVEISLISVAISIVLGLIVGVFMTSRRLVPKILLRIYLETVRIMPQMVLLFIVYFGSTRVFGLSITAEVSAVIVFVFWGTAEMGDLVRGSIKSIPKVQYESAYALGMNKYQVYFYIIFPQTLRRLLPLSINLVTRMIKTTSLVMMIGIVEVLKVAQQIIEANRRTSPNAAFGVFAVVFLLYFIVCWPISRLASVLEKRWA
ncbi:MAG: amino acid ABC transporter permease [Butyrivibrio sp.]|uniref:amino acid ABC transporter permease n=1 Tax=Butyrivibrio sp. TaxID=28121 RepID=UPI0025FF8308|nr:amino acid ABC transporter permease [Butyrivibrio sp.]MCR5772329.1 amino acid ABC transporter permease [Butyrivibrio sp.]